MNDRFIRGLIAGAAGGAAAVAVNLFLINIVRFGQLRFYDISGVMIFGREPERFAEKVFAEIGHLGLSATVGIILAYVFPRMKSRYLWIKGLFFGCAVWYAVYAVMVLYKVPEVKGASLPSAIANLVSSGVFGLVTVGLLKLFDRHAEQT